MRNLLGGNIINPLAPGLPSGGGGGFDFADPALGASLILDFTDQSQKTIVDQSGTGGSATAVSAMANKAGGGGANAGTIAQASTNVINFCVDDLPNQRTNFGVLTSNDRQHFDLSVMESYAGDFTFIWEGLLLSYSSCRAVAQLNDFLISFVDTNNMQLKFGVGIAANQVNHGLGIPVNTRFNLLIKRVGTNFTFILNNGTPFVFDAGAIPEMANTFEYNIIGDDASAWLGWMKMMVAKNGTFTAQQESDLITNMMALP